MRFAICFAILLLSFVSLLATEDTNPGYSPTASKFKAMFTGSDSTSTWNTEIHNGIKGGLFFTSDNGDTWGVVTLGIFREYAFTERLSLMLEALYYSSFGDEMDEKNEMQFAFPLRMHTGEPIIDFYLLVGPSATIWTTKENETRAQIPSIMIGSGIAVKRNFLLELRWDWRMGNLVVGYRFD